MFVLITLEAEITGKSDTIKDWYLQDYNVYNVQSVGQVSCLVAVSVS